MDRNGQVDISDLAVQMTARSDISAYQSRQQLSDPDLLTVADVNHDGAFDNADLQALLVLLANSASITPGASASQAGESSQSIAAEPSLSSPYVIGSEGSEIPHRRVKLDSRLDDWQSSGRSAISDQTELGR